MVIEDRHQEGNGYAFNIRMITECLSQRMSADSPGDTSFAGRAFDDPVCLLSADGKMIQFS